MPEEAAFIKYHGTGNDFLIFDAWERGPFLGPQVIAAICTPHTGVGADGVIFACSPRTGAEARMRIFNADGSEAEMCGNGIRCLAKYLHEHRGIGGPRMFIETEAGAREINLLLRDGVVEEVEVDMGIPEFSSSDLPPSAGEDRATTLALPDGEEVECLCVSMGNPHCVIFVEDLDNAPVAVRGPQVENHPLFPNRVNVEFVRVLGADRIAVRVWERGVGETRACGTGACAAFVAAVRAGFLSRSAVVELPGGELRTSVDDHGHVWLAGPAVEVFRGELNPSWLHSLGGSLR